jgi:hypothetical protein
LRNLTDIGTSLTGEAGLGAPLANGYELASNIEMSKRAQKRALVKPLQQGIQGAGLRRKGRKARAR